MEPDWCITVHVSKNAFLFENCYFIHKIRKCFTKLKLPNPFEFFLRLQIDDRKKYDDIFVSLGPQNGKLTGDQVRPVLINSNLPTNVLGKIWDLSDIDRDGSLDREEMSVALHLVYRSLEGETVPVQLPVVMIPPSKRGLARASLSRRTSGQLPGAVQVLPNAGAGHRSRTSSVTSVDSVGMVSQINVLQQSTLIAQQNSNRSMAGTPVHHAPVRPPSAAPWIVNPTKYESAFNIYDTDNDGFVTGNDVRQAFLQSQLNNNTLAHIWGLCDFNQAGKLNFEQFALAMHLIEDTRLQGKEPPNTLPPDLIPPSMRPSPAGMTDISTSTSLDPTAELIGSFASAIPNAQQTGNKDIDEVTKEIAILQKDKRALESGVMQLEADLTVKNSEIKNLEVEFNSLQSTVKQLERQQIEAQKRLDDMDKQRDSLQNNVDEMKTKIDTERGDVQNFRSKFETSANAVKTQSEDLDKRRTELQSLRDAEHRAQVTVEMKKASVQQKAEYEKTLNVQSEQISTNLNKLQNHETVLKQRLEQLVAVLALEDGIRAAIDADATILADKDLHIDLPPIRPLPPPSALPSTSFTNTPAPTMSNSDSGGFGQNKVDDPFSKSDPFGSSADPFKDDDPFTKSDPFGAADPFAGSGGFGQSAFGSNNNDIQTAAASKKPPSRPPPPRGRPVTPKVANDDLDKLFPKCRSGSVSSASGDPFQSSGGEFADFSQFS